MKLTMSKNIGKKNTPMYKIEIPNGMILLGLDYWQPGYRATEWWHDKPPTHPDNLFKSRAECLRYYQEKYTDKFDPIKLVEESS